MTNVLILSVIGNGECMPRRRRNMLALLISQSSIRTHKYQRRATVLSPIQSETTTIISRTSAELIVKSGFLKYRVKKTDRAASATTACWTLAAM